MMNDKPCPCCGHDGVAVNLVIKDIPEQNETLRAERDALAYRLAEIEARGDDEAVFGEHNLISYYKAERDAAVARADRAEEALRKVSDLKMAHVRFAPSQYYIFVQSIVSAALAAASDKPHYAALSPEPWGGPEGEEE